MLTEKEIQEIRDQLESSQNPLFFFDNDTDGLCSFLLLRRFIGRGNGVVIKSYPALDEGFARKIDEFNPDRIFILDKAEVAEEFLRRAGEKNIPVTWIDHHTPQNPPNVDYYNPRIRDPDIYEPASYLCYQVTRKDDWLVLMGCLGDHFLPPHEFIKRFVKEYPGIFEKHDTILKAKYENGISKLIKLVDFSLKDKTTNVIGMLKVMISAKGPEEILKKEKQYDAMWRRFEQINKKYQALLEKALKSSKGKFLFFRYSGDMSISRELSEELSYHFPGKLIVVVYVRDEVAKVSLREGNKDLRKVVKDVLKVIEGTGGGHEKSVGMAIKTKDIDTFKELLEKEYS